MTQLDALIERARSATVDRAEAERYVRELDRWARPEPRPQRWLAWLALGVAAAAVAVVSLFGRGAVVAGAPVRLGERVAIVASPGAVYRVVRADGDASEIAVERGAITARLWPGPRLHKLVLSGGGVTAAATGTVYRLAVDDGGPVVSVVEGTVEVHAADGPHKVTAGASWPVRPVAPPDGAARALLALAAPAAAGSSSEPADAAQVPVDAGAADVDGEPSDGEPSDGELADAARAAHAAAARDAAPAPTTTIKDRWRTARLLRGQGQFSAALAECLAIADASDPTWSPIALVEAVRIELGPLVDPERAISLADRMIAAWPSHELVPEARELRCRALRQLGRAAECAAPPPSMPPSPTTPLP